MRGRGKGNLFALGMRSPGAGPPFSSAFFWQLLQELPDKTGGLLGDGSGSHSAQHLYNMLPKALILRLMGEALPFHGIDRSSA